VGKSCLYLFIFYGHGRGRGRGRGGGGTCVFEKGNKILNGEIRKKKKIKKENVLFLSFDLYRMQKSDKL
jgi:hypothetical protein